MFDSLVDLTAALASYIDRSQAPGWLVITVLAANAAYVSLRIARILINGLRCECGQARGFQARMRHARNAVGYKAQVKTAFDPTRGMRKPLPADYSFRSNEQFRSAA